MRARIANPAASPPATTPPGATGVAGVIAQSEAAYAALPTFPANAWEPVRPIRQYTVDAHEEWIALLTAIGKSDIEQPIDLDDPAAVHRARVIRGNVAYELIRFRDSQRNFIDTATERDTWLGWERTHPARQGDAVAAWFAYWQGLITAADALALQVRTQAAELLAIEQGGPIPGDGFGPAAGGPPPGAWGPPPGLPPPATMPRDDSPPWLWLALLALLASRRKG